MSLIEKELMKEIREQKRTASNVHAMKGKRGYVGVMRFPKNNFKRYEKNGKVVSFNMFDTMIPYDEFKVLPEEDQAKYLQEYRNRFRNEDILKTWKIGSNTLYNYVKKFKLPRADRTDNNDKPRVRRNKKNTEIKTMVDSSLIQKRNEELQDRIDKLEKELAEKESQGTVTAQLIPSDGMNISYNGEYSADQLMTKLDKLSLLIQDEKNKYNVKIYISEKEVETAS